MMPDERVSAALALLGFDPGDARVTGNLSGTGSRSVRLEIGGIGHVLRIAEPETAGLVERTRERDHSLVAARLGLGPGMVAADPGAGLSMTRFVEGERLDTIARPFGHDVLARLAGVFDRLRAAEGFRGVMDPWERIAAYLEEAGCRDPSGEDAFGPAWNAIRNLQAECRPDGCDPVAAHVDPVPENIIDRGDRIVLLDWEYSARAHPMWDPAYLAAEAGFDDEECRALFASGRMPGDLRSLKLWMMAAKAVSLSWCILRCHRAGDSSSWHRETRRRRTELSCDIRSAIAAGIVPP